ncbi:MAG: hypothetical protein ACLSFZ_02775 [Frisingicoccus sp.]
MRKIDEEKFLYSVSEESIMKTWDNEAVENMNFLTPIKISGRFNPQSRRKREQ